MYTIELVSIRRVCCYSICIKESIRKNISKSNQNDILHQNYKHNTQNHNDLPTNSKKTACISQTTKWHKIIQKWRSKKDSRSEPQTIPSNLHHVMIYHNIAYKLHTIYTSWYIYRIHNNPAYDCMPKDCKRC